MYQSFEQITTNSSTGKTSTTNPYNIKSFKYIATILIESYELNSYLVISTVEWTSTTPRVSISCFVRRIVPMNSISPSGHFLSLDKKTVKWNISFFLGQTYFQDTLSVSLPGQAVSKACKNRLHVDVNCSVQLSGSKTQREQMRRTNSAQESYSLRKRYSVLTLISLEFATDRKTDEGSGVRLSKENCQRRVQLSIRKVEVVPFNEQRKDELK